MGARSDLRRGLVHLDARDLACGFDPVRVAGRDLPEGFQRSEFVLEHGFLDFIVDRKELKGKLATVFDMLLPVKAEISAT